MKYKVTKSYSTSVVVEADTPADALALANAYKAMHICMRIRDDVFAGNKVEVVPEDTPATTIALKGEEGVSNLREEQPAPEPAAAPAPASEVNPDGK